MNDQLTQMIKSSKIFNMKRNKTEILAAFDNPINVDLKQQLVKNLDDKYQSDKYTDPNYEEPKIEPIIPTSLDDTENNNEDDKSGDSDAKPSRTYENKLKEEPNNISNKSKEDNKVDTKDETKTSDDGVEISESVDINIINYNISEVIDALKSDTNTSDFIDIQTKIKDDDVKELWITYADHININNILSDVLSIMHNICPDAEFNRLARTFNSIVFTFNGEVDDVIE